MLPVLKMDAPGFDLVRLPDPSGEKASPTKEEITKQVMRAKILLDHIEDLPEPQAGPPEDLEMSLCALTTELQHLQSQLENERRSAEAWRTQALRLENELHRLVQFYEPRHLQLQQERSQRDHVMMERYLGRRSMSPSQMDALGAFLKTPDAADGSKSSGQGVNPWPSWVADYSGRPPGQKTAEPQSGNRLLTPAEFQQQITNTWPVVDETAAGPLYASLSNDFLYPKDSCGDDDD